MSGTGASSRVVATAAARQAIRRLRADRGPLMFHQSGGCCDGSLPICLDAGELLVGDGDLLLGEIDGCRFYIDARQDAAWGEPQLILDVAPGAPEGFSLAAGDGLHFVTLTGRCRSAPTSSRNSATLGQSATARRAWRKQTSSSMGRGSTIGKPQSSREMRSGTISAQ
jgi:uncharacterized protein (DUF779 family)